MTEPAWLAMQLKTDKIPAKPREGIWTLACGYVKGPVKLKIQANGTWDYSPMKTCGPDGARSAGFLADALVPSAPLGALIGKIGGSPAEKPDARSVSFVAGSYSVVILDDKAEGALFFSMNDQVSHFDDHDKEVTISIEQARS
ncbi:MAG: hypothetical protein ABSG65_04685 [Bryobacteraceae bacterium]|jgi:hypothetical protein